MSDEILWIGNSSRLEFTRITDALKRSASLVECSDLASLPPKIGTPACVCFAAARPGEISARQLELVRNRFPASAHVTVLGELCCGLKRTHSFLDPDSTVYAHKLPTNLSLETLRQTLNSPFAVGLAPTEQKLVAIYANSSSYQSGIAEALEMLGLKTAQLRIDEAPVVSGVDVVVYEASDGIDEFPALRELQRRHPSAEIVALVSYPREYEVARYEQQGIRVLSQPYNLNNLFSFFRSTREFLATSAA